MPYNFIRNWRNDWWRSAWRHVTWRLTSELVNRHIASRKPNNPPGGSNGFGRWMHCCFFFQPCLGSVSLLVKQCARKWRCFRLEYVDDNSVARVYTVITVCFSSYINRKSAWCISSTHAHNAGPAECLLNRHYSRVKGELRHCVSLLRCDAGWTGRG
jgi:hypothetical protein